MVSVFLSHKYLEDESSNNINFTELGVTPSLQELSLLELEFLRKVRFCLTINTYDLRAMEPGVLGS